MAPVSTFGERFGYACWLFYLKSGRAPSYAAIGRVANRTGEAVSAWAGATAPPSDFNVHQPTADFLGVDERWLFRDEGQAPRPELWNAWIAERRGKPARPESTVPYHGKTPRPSARAAKKDEGKRRA